MSAEGSFTADLSSYAEPTPEAKAAAIVEEDELRHAQWDAWDEAARQLEADERGEPTVKEAPQTATPKAPGPPTKVATESAVPASEASEKPVAMAAAEPGIRARVPHTRLGYGAMDVPDGSGNWVDAAHVEEVAAAVERLRVQREARAAFAVELGAFGVFDSRKIVDINDLGSQAGTEYLIERILERGAISMLFANGFVGKSFVVLDWAACVATGRSWYGRIVARGRVLYVALEGHHTFPKRMAAWTQHFGEKVANGGIEVYPATVNMLDATSVDALASYLKEKTYDLVIIDTLSRAIAGGDENSTEQMGAFIASLAQIREAHEPSHILVLHHSKKDDVEKYRGNSVLFDGFDNVFCLRRVLLGDDAVSLADPRRRLIYQKVKSGQPEPQMNFAFEQVTGTGSAVLVLDVRAGLDPVARHLGDMLSNRAAGAGPITRTELKASLVTAGIYLTAASANARISTLISAGVLVFQQNSAEISVGRIG